MRPCVGLTALGLDISMNKGYRDHCSSDMLNRAGPVKRSREEPRCIAHAKLRRVLVEARRRFRSGRHAKNIKHQTANIKHDCKKVEKSSDDVIWQLL